MRNDGKRRESEGKVSKPAAASQPIKSPEWEAGVRETLKSHRLRPVTAECSKRGVGQAEMREGAGGSLFGERRPEEGKGKAKPLWGYNSGNAKKELARGWPG